jgi:hypothetical protein
MEASSPQGRPGEINAAMPINPQPTGPNKEKDSHEMSDGLSHRSQEVRGEVRSRVSVPDADDRNDSGWWKIHFFRGMIVDIRRRAPYYVSDWTDAWDYRVVPATIYMYFAKYELYGATQYLSFLTPLILFKFFYHSVVIQMSPSLSSSGKECPVALRAPSFTMFVPLFFQAVAQPAEFPNRNMRQIDVAARYLPD